jgi:UDP-N-acetyl-D-glucosamine dehydrogenase
VRKALNGSRVVVLGVAYKPNVSDVRESPAMDVIVLLQEKGATVTYYDPFVPTLEHEGIPVSSTPLTAELLNGADCVVVVTHHDAIDWHCVVEEAPLIVDTRNALRHLKGRGQVIPL